jgi:hypothetical protein
MIAAIGVIVVAAIVGIVVWQRPSTSESQLQPNHPSGFSGGGSSAPAQRPPSGNDRASPPAATLVLPSLNNNQDQTQHKTTPPPAQRTPPQKQPPPEKEIARNQPPPPAPPPVDTAATPLQKAQAMFAKQQLLTPPNDCALYWAQRATAVGDRRGAEIERGIQQVVLEEFRSDLQSGNYSQASQLITEMEHFYPGRLQSWKNQLDAAQHK